MKKLVMNKRKLSSGKNLFDHFRDCFLKLFLKNSVLVTWKRDDSSIGIYGGSSRLHMGAKLLVALSYFVYVWTDLEKDEYVGVVKQGWDQVAQNHNVERTRAIHVGEHKQGEDHE